MARSGLCSRRLSSTTVLIGGAKFSTVMGGVQKFAYRSLFHESIIRPVSAH